MKFLVTGLLALALIQSSGAAQNRVSDDQIATRVATIIDKDPIYRNVQFDVDDRIVTLAGAVELLSQKESLEYRIEKLKGVARVVNVIVLDPTAISDEILLARVDSNLSIWADRVRWTVHDGRVELRGMLTRQQSARLIASVWNIPGVREVKSGLQIVHDQ